MISARSLCARRLLSRLSRAGLSTRPGARDVSPVCDQDFLRFQLFEVLRIQNDILPTDRYSHVSLEDIEASVAVSHDLAEKYFLPHARENDLNEPSFSPGGGVSVIPEVAAALEAFRSAGFFRLVYVYI